MVGSASLAVVAGRRCTSASGRMSELRKIRAALATEGAIVLVGAELTMECSVCPARNEKSVNTSEISGLWADPDTQSLSSNQGRGPDNFTAERSFYSDLYHHPAPVKATLLCN
jgi:hypothetical protein